MANGLMLHAGSRAVSRDELASASLPPATDSFQPIGHNLLVDLVEAELKQGGISIVAEQYAMSKDQQRMFGMMELASTRADFTVVVGIRNSNDKSFPAALATGDRVFVCDNLAFSAEVVLARKHTTFILRDLSSLVVRGVARLADVQGKQLRRIEAYKNVELTDRDVHDFLVRCIDHRAFPVTHLPAILKQWRKPNHDAFLPRNAWSLRNAFTDVQRGGNILELPRRTQTFQGLMDVHCGLLGPARNLFESVAGMFTDDGAMLEPNLTNVETVEAAIAG